MSNDSIDIEDYPSSWEESFVLKHKKLKFDDMDFAKASIKVKETLQQYYDDNNIDFKVENAENGYVKIDDKIKIGIEKPDQNIFQIFKLENDLKSDKYIQISIKEFLYVIEYVNCENKKMRARYNLDQYQIEELLGEVISL